MRPVASPLVSALAAAREALERHDWQGAYDLAAPGEEPAADPLDDAQRLELRAEAAWWLGRLDECVALREAAYALFDEHGAERAAGQCAVWLYEHYCFKSQASIGGAWLRRARQRLGSHEESQEYGSLVLREMEVAHGQGEVQAAAAQAQAVLELGRRLRIADLEAEALQALGRVLVDQGQVREGLGLLDEAMLLALEGRLGPYSTGKVYCSLITACEAIGDYRRATEWTEATARWSSRHPFAVFPGLCRVHRAWALQCRGDWRAAEDEVVRACAELRTASPHHAAAGFVELGEVRRRVGDLAGAESAFQEAEALTGHAPPGLALVRLAQGRVDAATAIIGGALDGEVWNRLARARLLPARVEIAVAAGDVATAQAAAEELRATATDYDSPALLAASATALGRVLVAEGDGAAARAMLREAADRWRALDVPYEVGIARLLLGQACRVAGDEDGALVSLRAAESAFEQLGAAPDTRRARELQQRAAALPAGLTDREGEVLRLVASGRTNREIAEALYLSERTVARHLSNIFTKTGVSTRSAATAYAFEHGLAGGPAERTLPH
jgi:DNA-binding CsgD family transcriptional regulator